MSDISEVTEPVKRGRKKSPLTAVTADWAKAKHRAEKARKARQKCEDIQAELALAEDAEAVAYDNLQAVLASLAPEVS